jgi:hypothetical protein
LDAFVVKLVEDLQKNESGLVVLKSSNPRDLLTVSTCNGDRLGAFVRSASSVSLMARPVLEAEAPLPLMSRMALSTQSDSDKDFLKKLSGEGAASALQGLASSLAIVKAEETETPRKTRLECKVQGLKAACDALLALFGQEGWQAVKESHFTKQVNSMSALHQEVAAVGEDERVVSECGLWTQGLTSGKLFCKGYREYGKCKHKHSKLMDLSKALIDFHNFMTTVNKPLATTLSLLVRKVKFYVFEDPKRPKSVRGMWLGIVVAISCQT